MSDKTAIKSLSCLFEEVYGAKPFILSIPGGGSQRKYYRLHIPGQTVVGVWSEDQNENRNFLKLNSTLEKVGIRVPKIIKVADDLRSYLLEDLGDISLFSLLSGPDKIYLSKKTLRKLIEIQTLPADLWKEKVGYKPFSERLIRWDLNYFKYDFLKPEEISFDEEALEDDFDLMVQILTDHEIKVGLMYRDFQSRNIMVKDGGLWFIDFQGARKGPLVYDAASFIWQAKAPFSFEEREELGRYYCEELNKKTGQSFKKINDDLQVMVVFRTLQVLGAYGFRGLIEKKSHFLQSIPYALDNLNYLKNKGVLDPFTQIKKICEELNNKKMPSFNTVSGKLIISVYSFSYKKGYPVDLSGNGGGFMFDCRAIHNPGRYEKYKSMTGKDRQVIEFLESNDEAINFVDKAVDIVKPSIERYLKRGFTSLQVGFGCTGGQHRSVYCAERFARLISVFYPEVNINVKHREQE